MYRNVAKISKYDRGPRDWFRGSRGIPLRKPEITSNNNLIDKKNGK